VTTFIYSLAQNAHMARLRSVKCNAAP